MFCCARMGAPAATRPTTGRPSSSWAPGSKPGMRMPREAPGVISMAPLRASALRCSSAALGDLKPSSWAISARVGGKPLSSRQRLMNARISAWRGVSFSMAALCFFIQ
ncbi:hypothetical protein D3C77_641370 [compost metagenome]